MSYSNNVPKIGNTVANDLTAMEANFVYIQSAITRAVTTWDDSSPTTLKFSTSCPFNNGTYDLSIPSIGASSVFLLGETNTILWFYLNTAPQGWKILPSTPSDVTLAVKGGSDAWDVGGGQTAGTWTQNNHIHRWCSHINDAATHDQTFNASGALIDLPAGYTGNYEKNNNIKYIDIRMGVTTADNFYSLDTSYTDGQATVTTWRPAAAVGILCQVDA